MECKMESPVNSNLNFTPLHKGRCFICYRDVNRAVEKHRELYGLRLVLKKSRKLEECCLNVDQMKDLNFRLKYGELDYQCSVANGRPGRPGNDERCPQLIKLRLSPDGKMLVVCETHVHEPAASIRNTGQAQPLPLPKAAPDVPMPVVSSGILPLNTMTAQQVAPLAPVLPTVILTACSPTPASSAPACPVVISSPPKEIITTSPAITQSSQSVQVPQQAEKVSNSSQKRAPQKVQSKSVERSSPTNLAVAKKSLEPKVNFKPQVKPAVKSANKVFTSNTEKVVSSKPLQKATSKPPEKALTYKASEKHTSKLLVKAPHRNIAKVSIQGSASVGATSSSGVSSSSPSPSLSSASTLMVTVGKKRRKNHKQTLSYEPSPLTSLDTELGVSEKQQFANGVVSQLIKVMCELPMTEFSHALETVETLTDALRLQHRVSLSINQEAELQVCDGRGLMENGFYDGFDDGVSSTTGDECDIISGSDENPKQTPVSELTSTQLDGQLDGEVRGSGRISALKRSIAEWSCVAITHVPNKAQKCT